MSTVLILSHFASANEDGVLVCQEQYGVSYLSQLISTADARSAENATSVP